MRVIDEDGAQLGIMHPFTAMDVARQRGLDLVEVAPNAVPPVCRLMDYGRFRYEQTKRERESRRTQKTITIKEVRLTPKIDDHDLQTKANSAKRFLDAGDKVKLTVTFKGRQIVHPELGQAVLTRVIEGVGDAGTVEQVAKLEGKSMTSILAPKKQVVKPRRPSEDSEAPEDAEREARI